MSHVNYTRPPLADYQIKIIDSPARYTVCEAGTKNGKTSSHIIWLFEEALRTGKEGRKYFWVAPVYSQADTAFTRMKRQISNKELFTANETKMQIRLYNGAIIEFRSAEKPDNLYSEDIYGAVLDEFTRMKVEAWYAIRSTLTFTHGKAKFIGNVDGVFNWGYTLAREVEAGKQDWEYHRITATDAIKAGILTQEEVDDAQRTLPKGKFLELYFGIPDESSSNKFCYSFNRDQHVGKCKIDPESIIYLSFDFNVNPISAGIIQNIGGTIYIPHAIKLHNSNIYSLCDYIKKICPEDSFFIVTGDASGANRSALVRDGMNYFTIIKEQFNLSKNQIKVLPSNPRIDANQVLVNAILEHGRVQMDPENANHLIFDCMMCQVDINNRLVKTDRNDPAQQADSLDWFRYYLNTFHRDFIKMKNYEGVRDYE